METRIKLDVYPSAVLPLLINRQFKKVAEDNRLRKIAFAPADKITIEIINYLKKQNKDTVEIFVYDENVTNDFPYNVYSYNEVLNHCPDKIYILSSVNSQNIEERFLSIGVDKEKLINPYRDNDELLTIGEALDLIYSLKDTRNIEHLFSLLGEDNVAIINFPGYLYDVYEKIKILQNNLNMKIVLLDAVLQPEIDSNNETVRANLMDVINYIRLRNNMSNIMFFSVHPLWRLVILNLIRTAFPDIKIIAYIYDWIHLFCPYEQRALLRQYLSLPIDYINSEYKVMDNILDGRIANGIIHKDGGDDWTILKSCPSKKIFLPATISKQLHQETGSYKGKPDRFILMQLLYSPTTHLPDLFDDVFLFDVFKDILKQGYFIDIYYFRNSEDIADEYRQYFKGEAGISFIKGKPLNHLLPEVAGKYQWGYMIYRSQFRIVKQHVEAALPSRIFTYAALGIPIVINEELRYSAGFIRDNGIGVVVSKDDIPNLRAILSNVDYNKMQRNILKFREKYSLENYENRFIRFIQDCMMTRGYDQ